MLADRDYEVSYPHCLYGVAFVTFFLLYCSQFVSLLFRYSVFYFYLRLEVLRYVVFRS